ncbi:MAG TPA: decarboxylating 6-phosphogluconate dehydrogenase [Actinomycetota bacterium]|nr:decarboxylating 6-phosphogluconate dehydrogenase [Actinomycetota bacterium]
MRLGMVGLGKMGGNMTRRLLRDGHEIVGYAPETEAVDAVVQEGAEGAASIADVVSKLESPRCVWTMVPAGAPTESVVNELGELLTSGDVIIDGGNSHYVTSAARAEALWGRGISFIDCGTSGGVWGLDEGYCLMIGAHPNAFSVMEPIFRSLAPPNGYAHVGPPGSGHFVKMVHNGVEYALMQAYAEGFEILNSSDFGIDLPQVAEVWRYGSVVRSWLLDLAASALKQDPGLESLTGWVEDSGEGRWTLQTAIDNAVPAPTIALSLFARFASRQENAFSNRVLAALRREFGGHAVHSAHE